MSSMLAQAVPSRTSTNAESNSRIRAICSFVVLISLRAIPSGIKIQTLIEGSFNFGKASRKDRAISADRLLMFSGVAVFRNDAVACGRTE